MVDFKDIGLSNFKDIRYKALHLVRRYIDDKPNLFLFIMRHRSRYSNVLISEDTDIVVEGYPRSANTYLVAAIRLASHGRLEIASHTHALAQVYLAVQRSLPAVVTIRHPVDSVLSYLARQPEVSMANAIRAYLKFYGGVEGISKQIYLVRFEDVVSNFEKVSREISNRFSLTLDWLSNSDLERLGVFSVIEEMETMESGGELRETHVARPSSVREEQKAYYMSIMEGTEYEAEIKKCEELYSRLCGISYA